VDDALRALPRTERLAGSLTPELIEALDTSQPTVELTRPYTPELTATIAHLGQVTAYYDGNGHYARALPAGLNLFDYDSGTGVLDPIATSEQYDAFGSPHTFRRCPGGATQPAPDGSNPFVDPPIPGATIADSPIKAGQLRRWKAR